MSITIKEAVKDCRDLIEEYKDCSVEGLNMQVDVSFNENRCKNLEMILDEFIKIGNQISEIREEFLKYDWKNANNEQIYNQLKSLYESIFRRNK